jgi:hypothetical protein
MPCYPRNLRNNVKKMNSQPRKRDNVNSKTKSSVKTSKKSKSSEKGAPSILISVSERKN